MDLYLKERCVYLSEYRTSSRTGRMFPQISKGLFFLFIIFHSQGQSQCDLLNLSHDKNSALAPILLQNSLSHWNLSYAQWYQNFHSYKVQVSTSNSIVFNNGYTSNSELLSSFLLEMNSNYSNSYVFDLKLLKNSDLRDQYPPPDGISFQTQESIQNGTTSPFLSIGSVNSGFQFHAHGETWLGLLHGQKDWILYPPGYHMPLRTQLNWNPFLIPRNLNRKTLLEEYICNGDSDCLTNLEPLSLSASSPSNNFYSRPLFCSQHTGDVLYLPSGWSHMTINPRTYASQVEADGLISDQLDGSYLVVGIGGQRIWETAKRVEQCTEILFSSSQNFEDHDSSNMILSLLDSLEVLDYECLKSLGNIYKQKSHELMKQMIPLSSDTSREKICHFLQLAIEFYRKAIPIRPWHPDCRIQLIDSLLQLSLYNKTTSCSPLLPSDILEHVNSTDALLSDILHWKNPSWNRSFPLDILGIAITYQRLSTLIAQQFPLLSVTLLQKSLALYHKHQTILSNSSSSSSTSSSISGHSGYVKGLVQRVLLYEQLDDIPSALQSLNDMEIVTPTHPMISKTREYLENKMKSTQGREGGSSQGRDRLG